MREDKIENYNQEIINEYNDSLTEDEVISKIEGFMRDAYTEICDIESIKMTEEQFYINGAFRSRDMQDDFDRTGKNEDAESVEVQFEDVLNNNFA